MLLKGNYTSEHATSYSFIHLLPAAALLHFHFVFDGGQNFFKMTFTSELLIENYFLSLKDSIIWNIKEI